MVQQRQWDRKTDTPVASIRRRRRWSNRQEQDLLLWKLAEQPDQTESTHRFKLRSSACVYRSAEERNLQVREGHDQRRWKKHQRQLAITGRRRGKFETRCADVWWNRHQQLH